MDEMIRSLPCVIGEVTSTCPKAFDLKGYCVCTYASITQRDGDF